MFSSSPSPIPVNGIDASGPRGSRNARTSTARSCSRGESTWHAKRSFGNSSAKHGIQFSEVVLQSPRAAGRLSIKLSASHDGPDLSCSEQEREVGCLVRIERARVVEQVAFLQRRRFRFGGSSSSRSRQRRRRCSRSTKSFGTVANISSSISVIATTFVWPTCAKLDRIRRRRDLRRSFVIAGVHVAGAVRHEDLVPVGHRAHGRVLVEQRIDLAGAHSDARDLLLCSSRASSGRPLGLAAPRMPPLPLQLS